MLAAAANGYRIAIEPEVPNRDNAGCEVLHTVDVLEGDQRIDLELETAHIVCVLGPRYCAAVEGAEQYLRWRDPDGRERTPIVAAIFGHNGAGRIGNRIEIEFLNVPVEARDLRFEFDGDVDEELVLTPLDLTLSAGQTVRVELD